MVAKFWRWKCAWDSLGESFDENSIIMNRNGICVRARNLVQVEISFMAQILMIGPLYVL